MAEPPIEPGWIAPELADELPGLALDEMRVQAHPGRSPEPVRQYLRLLADRITGAKAVHARQNAVAWAYRVLWRRVGIDPDTDRTPIEQLMLDRLRHGGLPSQGLPADAAVIATLETGVPIVVFDAARVTGRLGLRLAGADESLGGEGGTPLPVGQIVYCDERRPLARLTGEVAGDCAVGRDTDTMAVCALSVASVPRMAVEEALWTVADVLGGTGRVDDVDRGRDP